ncbi:uncharacterized protein LOC128226078 [Mya arenaria]|uniref:uncharacterized protein LOC128226078 n=1 Tax=Mya arenaria TaxID=6604 RepID=UPI0022E5B61A|nr:uncharacterized protein LOC128226078 [Mya arenaria]
MYCYYSAGFAVRDGHSMMKGMFCRIPLYPFLPQRESEYSTEKLKSKGFFKTLSTDQMKDIVIQKSECVDKLQNEARQMNEAMQFLNDDLKQKTKYVDDLRRENAALLQRLSKLAGEKLTRDNPDIADLSDRNRPTRLGEMFNELYDNEWTDAFEELVASGYDDREAVDTLQMALMKVFQFCEKKASLLVKQTENAANLLFEEFSRSGLQETNKNMPVGKKPLTIDPKQLVEMRGGLQREGSSMEDLQMQRKWKPKIKPDRKQTYIQTMVQPRTMNVEDKLKQMRKGVAESLVPSVQKSKKLALLMGNNRSKGGRDATCKVEDETLKEVEEEVAEWSRTIQIIKGNQGGEGAKMGERDLIHRMNTTAKKISSYISNVDEDQTGQAGLQSSVNKNGSMNPTSSSKRTQNEDGTCSGHDREVHINPSDLVVQIGFLKADRETMKKDITRLQEEISRKQAENDQLRIRLSKLAGDKLTKDNPNIADLSDRNRPTKLGEIYSELYDNEWTDAFEGLTKGGGYKDEEAIKALRTTLDSAYTFCVRNSNELVTKMEAVAEKLFEDITRREHSLTLPQSPLGRVTNPLLALEDHFIERHWKPKQRKEAQTDLNKQTSVGPTNMGQELIKMRKGVAVSMVPVVQHAYLRDRWDKECIESLKPFIKKSLFICWMMVVQTPPMVFDSTTKPDSRFDALLYRQYTASGDTVEYVVWPAMFLHEKGSLVLKGVAQPKKRV